MTPLPDSTRVGSVRLRVADLDRSLGFYRDLIGFRVLERGDGVARLGAGGSAAPGAAAGPDASTAASRPPALLELVERPGVRPVPRTGLMGIYHFALLLPSRPDLGRFVRHQSRLGTRFGAADHAFSEALYLEDPDGITLEVYRDRPRSEWPGTGGAGEDGGGLPLVSDPLDAAGLVAAAGEGEWDGVPAGAVVGHMHFFVDDLEAAEAFYVRGLGFAPMITHPTALFVAAGGYHHHVGLNTWRAGAPVATEDDAGLADWELVVPGDDAVEAVRRRLEDAGFEVARSEADPRGQTVVARDPWGITVRVTAG